MNRSLQACAVGHIKREYYSRGSGTAVGRPKRIASIQNPLILLAILTLLNNQFKQS